MTEQFSSPVHSDDIITRHLCMAADVEKYSRLDTPGQEAVQADLVRVLEEAAVLSGLDRTNWQRQPQGDQEFAVLPLETPEPMVLGGFVRNLAVRLGERNANTAESERMRLRLAIDFGVARTAALGYSGPAPVSVARYLNAPQLKRVLEGMVSTDLALIVSDHVYQDVVRLRGEGQSLDPRRYLRVHVCQKEFSGYGWIHVPEHTPEELEPLVEEPAAEPEAPVAAPTPTHVVKRNKGGVFHFGSGDAARRINKKY
ncbi:hypothetical protein I3J09_02155 [Streptomyces clavuligerus]|uniref:hypothetical protein n=1 Tax=Streptomyces clavuligerus TaxID=1901 RepID=UPI000810E974|nr:hypothetical protein [Streptomyces clavuligerus]ANW17107.1 hypothetical protein BB341_02165 [Streptomyces clavuligerus]AXU11645.1 hypothetical protein D1794_02270 [Streptomyces clavuligerus]MBY6301482.1 hypothetical protein [Streptomyces clavuligerus]QPL61766.1 hypothetical protein I3J04_02140 [Streptomyces clavuligerus]QPL67799.1 hypothetical protein I3J05_02155 [Streptomyces clavuligerus]